MNDYLETFEVVINEKMKVLSNKLKEKNTSCEQCPQNAISIIENKDSITLTCGGKDGTPCGTQIHIKYPSYIHIEDAKNILYKKLNEGTNWKILMKYFDDIEKDVTDMESSEKKYKETLQYIEDLVSLQQPVKLDFIQFKENRISLKARLSEIQILLQDTDNNQTDLRREYVVVSNELQNEYIEFKKKYNEIARHYFVVESPPQVTIKNNSYKNTKTSKKDIVQTDELSDESSDEDIIQESTEALREMTNIDEFQKREDKFSSRDEKTCLDSVTWRKLSSIKDPKKYAEYVLEISTNPEYPTFNQIYFNAADSLQFEKYGLLKTRMLSYPSTTKNNPLYSIFQNYNIDTTYHTFKYIFEHLKKGVYISLRNNELFTFLPFNNIHYMNTWNKVLSEKNPKLVKDILNQKRYNEFTNVKDPAKWYANNCIFTTGNMKKPYQDFLAEGDKTLIPFKYFMIGYISYLKETDQTITDMDFFFNPRDFPILKQGAMDPYDQIYPNESLDPQYIHESYTPILSQSGKKDFHDIPIPTEDDMMRITTDIYPDDCKNKYNEDPDIITRWEDKESTSGALCVFRGSATGCGITADTNMRLKAVVLSEQWKQEGKSINEKPILDAKLTSWNMKPKIYNGDVFDKIKPKDFSGVKAGQFNYMSLKEQSKHKYILNIDGHVKAFRLGNEMKMGSVILLVDSPYTLWFQDKLIDKTHYVSLKSDLSDLQEKIQWCEDNPQECKQIAQNSIEFYETYLTKQGTYDYFNNILQDLSLLRKKPVYEKNTNKLNIIVAFRDMGDNYRQKQLDIFVQQMKHIFHGTTDYHIYIIEQESERDDYEELPEDWKVKNSTMAKFNLGRIKNIGYSLAFADNRDNKDAYYVLSDVDLLPSVESINDYLKFPKNPIHLAALGTRYSKDKIDKGFLGGVLSVDSTAFTKCNGYPNNFWGWGGEDNALLSRMKTNNISIEKSEHPVIDLENISEIKQKTSALWEQGLLMDKKIRKEKRQEDKTSWETNGLNDIDTLYKIKGRENTGNVSHIKVFLLTEPQEINIPPPQEINVPPLQEINVPPLQGPVVGDRVEFIKNKKTITGVIESETTTGVSFRICCKPDKQSGEKGSTYLVKKGDVALLLAEPQEINVPPLQGPTIGDRVEFIKNKKTITGVIESETTTGVSFRICCKPDKQSGEKGSTYLVKKGDVIRVD